MYGDQHPLVPQDPLLKARVREVADMVTSGIQPLQSIGILRHVKVADVRGGSGDGNAYARWKTEEGLDALERLIGQMRTSASNVDQSQGQSQSSTVSSTLFAVGTSYPTLADLCLIPQLYNARYRLHIPVNDLTYPHLTAVERLCESLHFFKQAEPQNQPDAVDVL